MIKFEHTVFALPFAFLAALGAARGIPSVRTILWILVAMVGARTAAMTFNRLADLDLDGENPRTANRALPSGRVSLWAAYGMLGLAILVFCFAAAMLGPLPYRLAPLALGVILGYSFCKRFTSWSHGILGLSLAAAPLGAWIAVAGRVEVPAWALATGVLAWSAGFDIIYALQDEAFDRRHGLHALPARVGARRALRVSRGLHALATLAWGAYNVLAGAHLPAWLAWAAVVAILVQEHRLVGEGRLERVDAAFFAMNSWVGPIFFVGHLMEWFVFHT